MKKKTVIIEFEVPEGVSDEDFEEWAMFVLGWNAGCSINNPMIDEYCASDLETSFDIRNW